MQNKKVGHWLAFGTCFIHCKFFRIFNLKSSFLVTLTFSSKHFFLKNNGNLRIDCFLWSVSRFNLLNTLKLASAVFIKFSFFHQMIALQNLWKMLFISSKILFSFSRYSNFSYFCPSFFFCLSGIALEDDRR